VTRIGALLSTLDDPFEMFPLDSVARGLADLVSASDETISDHSGWWGVSRKYYSVEQEHHVEVIALLIGSTFVLGQTAITQTVAISKKLHSLAGEPNWFPSDRRTILRTEAAVHVETSLSELILFDAVANYFKHHYEWPDDWNPQRAEKPQRRTIEIVRRLGLSPESREDNLRIAVQNLGLTTSDMVLGARIQAWCVLRSCISLAGVSPVAVSRPRRRVAGSGRGERSLRLSGTSRACREP